MQNLKRRAGGQTLASRVFAEVLSERRENAALLAVIALTVALFLPTLGYALTFDDLGTVVEHPGVQSHGLSLRDIFFRDWWGRPFGDPNGVPTFRPLVTFTFWINQRIGGFHLTNVALYASLLFVAHRFLCAWGVLEAGLRVAVIAVFAVLAIHADVVPSVTGRGEILTMLFLMTALLFAVRQRVVLASVACAFAILCKESAMPMALAIPFVAWRAGLSRRRATVLFGVAAALVAAMALFRVRAGLPFRATHVGVEEGNPLYLATWSERLPGAMEILARYGVHTTAGVDLCADYSYAELVPTRSWLSGWAVVGGVIAVSLIVVMVRAWKRVGIADAILLFGASYVAVSQVFSPATASLADRLFFFPSFWVVVAIAVAASRSRLLLPIAAVFVVVHAILASLSMRMWRDERSLALHNIATCPQNGRVREMRAHVAYLDRDVEQTAWQHIARAALYNQFPGRIPDDVLTAEWEALPFAERLARLRAWKPERYRDAVIRGLYLAHSGGYREAEAFIAAMARAP